MSVHFPLPAHLPRATAAKPALQTRKLRHTGILQHKQLVAEWIWDLGIGPSVLPMPDVSPSITASRMSRALARCPGLWLFVRNTALLA